MQLGILIGGSSSREVSQRLSAIRSDGDLKELYYRMLESIKPKHKHDNFVMFYLAFAMNYEPRRYVPRVPDSFNQTLLTRIQMDRQLISWFKGFLEIQETSHWSKWNMSREV